MASENLFLLRLGAELAIKSRRTRSGFLRRLQRNVRDAMESTGEPFSVEGEWSRLYVRSASPQAAATLSRVFGISSLSPMEATVPATLDAIVDAGVERFADVVRGKRFAVRAHRAGRHAFSSKDVEIRLGAALLGYADRVDLTHPEATVFVDVHDDVAHLFSHRVDGAGGLPMAVEGNAVALISGGFDSAVAAWLLMRRGVALDFVFCNLGGDAYERAVVQVSKVLADDWSYGTRPRLHVVDFTEPLRALRAVVKESYWQLVLKRLMYRTASAVGGYLRAAAIVTGEAVGQVSSQTLHNLRALEPAASLPLFRPLLGFEKEEIIARARHVGTAALSEQVKEYCAIAPGKPVTAATVERVDAEEAKLDPALLDDVVASRKVLDLRALTPSDLVAPYLFTTTVPEGAVVIDCRPEPQYRSWHLPGAVQRDEWEMLRDIKRLDRERTYVLYCAHGVQTAYLAERMQRAGYEAYSFKGGVRGVMKYASENGLLPSLG